ncbi:MAG: hypothetical protein LBV20_04355 [Treponema sp.]|jgi:hypothetical protein|nr:hypothetical protein [Treponema sp.]
MRKTKRLWKPLKAGDFEWEAEELPAEKVEDLKDPEKFRNYVYEWSKKHAPEDIENKKPEDFEVWHFNEATDSFELFQKS